MPTWNTPTLVKNKKLSRWFIYCIQNVPALFIVNVRQTGARTTGLITIRDGSSAFGSRVLTYQLWKSARVLYTCMQQQGQPYFKEQFEVRDTDSVFLIHSQFWLFWPNMKKTWLGSLQTRFSWNSGAKYSLFSYIRNSVSNDTSGGVSSKWGGERFPNIHLEGRASTHSLATSRDMRDVHRKYRIINLRVIPGYEVKWNWQIRIWTLVSWRVPHIMTNNAIFYLAHIASRPLVAENEVNRSQKKAKTV